MLPNNNIDPLILNHFKVMMHSLSLIYDILCTFSSGLPLFPPLPVDTDEKVVEEIRRTVVVMGISQTASAQEVMDYFATGAGEVKYFRQMSNI